jgi:hypothetical protein
VSQIAASENDLVAVSTKLGQLSERDGEITGQLEKARAALIDAVETELDPHEERAVQDLADAAKAARRALLRLRTLSAARAREIMLNPTDFLIEDPQRPPGVSDGPRDHRRRNRAWRLGPDPNRVGDERVALNRKSAPSVRSGAGRPLRRWRPQITPQSRPGLTPLSVTPGLGRQPHRRTDRPHGNHNHTTDHPTAADRHGEFDVDIAAGAVTVTHRASGTRYTFARHDRWQVALHGSAIAADPAITGDTGDYPTAEVLIVARRLAEATTG